MVWTRNVACFTLHADIVTEAADAQLAPLLGVAPQSAQNTWFADRADLFAGGMPRCVRLAPARPAHSLVEMTLSHQGQLPQTGRLVRKEGLQTLALRLSPALLGRATTRIADLGGQTRPRVPEAAVADWRMGPQDSAL